MRSIEPSDCSTVLIEALVVATEVVLGPLGTNSLLLGLSEVFAVEVSTVVLCSVVEEVVEGSVIVVDDSVLVVSSFWVVVASVDAILVVVCTSSVLVAISTGPT